MDFVVLCVRRERVPGYGEAGCVCGFLTFSDTFARSPSRESGPLSVSHDRRSPV